MRSERGGATAITVLVLEETLSDKETIKYFNTVGGTTQCIDDFETSGANQH